MGSTQAPPTLRVLALPHHQACLLAGSLGGRPNAAEHINPFLPADCARSTPPTSAAPRGLESPRVKRTGEVRETQAYGRVVS